MERVSMTNEEEMKDIMKKLPVEMLLRIFQLLSYTDLKIVVLVCRRWREIGETQTMVLDPCHCEHKKHVYDAEDTKQR